MPEPTTFLDLVREKFPEVDDDEASYILWNHTGYPAFFQGDAATACRSQLTALATLGAQEGFGDPVIDLVDLRKARPKPYRRERILTNTPRPA